MTYKDLGALTDPLEAVKSLFAEMTAMKEGLSANKSDVARLNRNNTKLVVENRNLNVELAQTKGRTGKAEKGSPRRERQHQFEHSSHKTVHCKANNPAHKLTSETVRQESGWTAGACWALS